MECTGCPAMTDRSGKELVEHGSELFPAAFYVTRLEKENVAWHWHDEWEAGMVQEGKAVLLAGGERYVLGPGEGFFINGGVLHGLEQEPGCASVTFSRNPGNHFAEPAVRTAKGFAWLRAQGKKEEGRPARR